MRRCATIPLSVALIMPVKALAGACEILIGVPTMLRWVFSPSCSLRRSITDLGEEDFNEKEEIFFCGDRDVICLGKFSVGDVMPGGFKIRCELAA